MKRILLIILALLILFISPIIAEENEIEKTKKLIQNNCASCHTLGMPHPSSISSLPAPPMNAVIFHLKSEHKSYEKQKEFIVNYALDPKPEQSVCDMSKIEKFGVMPSLKGKVSKEDLTLIATHLLANFPSKEFVESRAEAKLYQRIHKLRNSPFLLNQSALPKITQLLMQNWGKGKLGLNDEQKKKLLNIRSRVIRGIKSIKEDLYAIERDIIEMSIYADDIETIELKVSEASKLKGKATMIQIRCILESVEILNEDQLAVLVPLWGM
jgi:cytochrome c